jgi:hypothetical protein
MKGRDYRACFPHTLTTYVYVQTGRSEQAAVSYIFRATYLTQWSPSVAQNLIRLFHTDIKRNVGKPKQANPECVTLAWPVPVQNEQQRKCRATTATSPAQACDVQSIRDIAGVHTAYVRLSSKWHNSPTANMVWNYSEQLEENTI